MPEQFTIVCEFEGGTYISQIPAIDEREAIREWAVLLRRDAHIGDASDRIAHAATREEAAPTPISGLTGVWCWTTTIDEKLVLANIIRSA